MTDEHAGEADAARGRRLAEAGERGDAGEFDLALDPTGYTGERGAAQQREAFAMVAWAARVGADPGEDFDAFVAELWKSVDGLFRIAERVGVGEEIGWGMFPPELVHPDDPPITEWGKR